MKRQYRHLTLFLSGGAFALVAALVSVVFLLANTADWLVVDNDPVKSDIGVVLGGGGGSRLRRAIDIYDKGFVDSLLLVDLKKQSWNHITSHLCPDCDLTEKEVTIIDGSTTTVTDARLSLDYCRNHAVTSVLIITDPYHTRRTALLFSRIFHNSGITTRVLSSGDYGNRLSPDDPWWRDSETHELVWLELGKSIAVLLAWNTLGQNQ